MPLLSGTGANSCAPHSVQKEPVLMKFLFGVAMGVIGMWAYRAGKLEGVLRRAPAPIQQTFQSGSGSDIAVPSASEVATRPSEPLPREQP
jgi:hypothetical protein